MIIQPESWLLGSWHFWHNSHLENNCWLEFLRVIQKCYGARTKVIINFSIFESLYINILSWLSYLFRLLRIRLNATWDPCAQFYQMKNLMICPNLLMNSNKLLPDVFKLTWSSKVGGVLTMFLIGGKILSISILGKLSLGANCEYQRRGGYLTKNMSIFLLDSDRIWRDEHAEI